MNMRKSGILMHVSSIPSKHGIGDFGTTTYDFIDFLAKAKQKIWQILPLGITGYGDSPYQSVSAFAGSPLYIDLQLLINRGFITEEDIDRQLISEQVEKVDYEQVKQLKYGALRKAYQKGFAVDRQAIEQFAADQADWIEDFCAFMAIKQLIDPSVWQMWDNAYKQYSKELVERIKHEHADEYWFWAFTQYHFFEQWSQIKAYANDKNIEIMGDIPIYVSGDSVDIWANPRLYAVDDEYNLTVVAGCPPDAFSDTGQLWGNPIYNWQAMREDDYSWWVARLKHSFATFDIVRIDHFRGFDAYWQIPASSDTAAVGEWVDGPGQHLFERLKHHLGDKPIVAEDLGFMTQRVTDLRQAMGYPGMAILQFAFNSAGDSDYLPHNVDKNCIIYTGTHDNDTMVGWIQKMSQDEFNYAFDYLRMSQDEGFAWGFIRGAWASCANTAIAQMQDFLELPNSARMNIPSTLGDNWNWRVKPEALNDTLAQRIAKLTQLYSR